MVRRTVKVIKVDDVEKRRQPSKHYVYIIYVTWSDGSINLIYRRYNSFFELQNKLLDKFPEESGTNDPAKRIIPFLPGKIIFGRSHIREVALKRLQSIDDYCKALIKLPAHISESDDVLDFLEPTADDLNPKASQKPSNEEVKEIKEISEPALLEQYVALANYLKEANNEASLREGQVVKVIEKTQTGWWFVNSDYEQGWVPSSYLQREDGTEENRVVTSTKRGDKGEKFMAIESYTACMADEISFEKGVILDVLERNLDGWWLIKYKGKKGRAPSTNLVEAEAEQADRLKKRAARKSATYGCVEKVPNMMAVSNIHLQNFSKISSASSSTGSTSRGRHVSFDSWTSEDEPVFDEECVYSSIDEGAAEASRKNLKRSKSAASDSSYRRSALPRRSSGSMRESFPSRFGQVKPRPPRPPPPTMIVTYTVIEDFTSQADDGLNLRKGQSLQVLEKDTTGWWLVKVEGRQGWAPASYIREQKTSRPERPPPPKFATRAASTAASIASQAAASAAMRPQPITTAHKEVFWAPGISSKSDTTTAKSGPGRPQPTLPHKNVSCGVSSTVCVPPSTGASNSSIAQGIPNKAKTDCNSGAGDQAGTSNIKNELELKFGVHLKSTGTSASTKEAESRISGHAPAKALLPKAGKPTGLLSSARGPVAAHFNSKTTESAENGTNAEDSDQLYANVSHENNVAANGIKSNNDNNSNSSSNINNMKKPAYVNIDDENSEATDNVLHKAAVMYDFTEAEEGEVCVAAGQIVDVLKDNVSGWSFVTTSEKAKGWCPANYLTKLDEDSQNHKGIRDNSNDSEKDKMSQTSGAGKVVTFKEKLDVTTPKVDMSELSKINLKSTQEKGHSLGTAGAKPNVPLKPSKALTTVEPKKKPAVVSSKPHIKTSDKPTLSPKPTRQNIKPGVSPKPTRHATGQHEKGTKDIKNKTENASVQQLAKVFDNK